MKTIDELVDELINEDDEQAEAAVQKLIAAGPGAAPVLQSRLADGDASPDARWWLARALAEFPGTETTQTLIRLLDDEDPSVRQCAALGLRKSPDPAAIPDLLRLLDDPDPLCADLAGDTLIFIGKAAVPPLIKTMEEGSLSARRQAARALALIGDTSAIPVLFKALDDESAIIEYWVNEGLERMGVGMTFFKP